MEMKILDKGYIKLITHMGSDEGIVEAARMSTGKGFFGWEPYARCDDCGLIWDFKYSEPHGVNCPKHKMVKYPKGDLGMMDTLWRKKHATPFEMADVIIEVYAPIGVYREWQRSRTQSFNEFSARYSQMPDVHYLPEPGRIQKQSRTNKQGSAESIPEDEALDVIRVMDEQQREIYATYDEWVEQGIAKETARWNTPVSRYSKMRAKANLRNWLWFLDLRMRPAAQWEIRQYANAMGEILKTLYPKTWGLFEEYNLYGASFSRTELQALRRIIGLIELPDGPTHQDMILQGGEKAGLTGVKLKEFFQKVDRGGLEIL